MHQFDWKIVCILEEASSTHSERSNTQKSLHCNDQTPSNEMDSFGSKEKAGIKGLQEMRSSSSAWEKKTITVLQ